MGLLAWKSGAPADARMSGSAPVQVVLAVAPNPAFALELGPVPAVLEPKKQVGAVVVWAAHLDLQLLVMGPECPLASSQMDSRPAFFHWQTHASYPSPPCHASLRRCKCR